MEGNFDYCIIFINTECEKGFESHQGQPCEPCQPNKYGEFCVEICECKAFQMYVQITLINLTCFAFNNMAWSLLYVALQQ